MWKILVKHCLTSFAAFLKGQNVYASRPEYPFKLLSNLFSQNFHQPPHYWTAVWPAVILSLYFVTENQRVRRSPYLKNFGGEILWEYEFYVILARELLFFYFFSAVTGLVFYCFYLFFRFVVFGSSAASELLNFTRLINTYSQSQNKLFINLCERYR